MISGKERRQMQHPKEKRSILKKKGRLKILGALLEGPHRIDYLVAASGATRQTCFPAFRELQGENLIEPVAIMENDIPRKGYQLTAKGKSILQTLDGGVS